MDPRWIERLFLEEGELYGEVLESFVPRTGEEAAWIAGVLEEGGIRPGSRVLDLACGVGRHSVELAARGYRVTGLDLSPAFVARARERAEERGLGEAAVFVAGDMRQVEAVLGGQRFDAVVSLFTSFGFYDEETDRSVTEQSRRLTRDGGVFLLDVMNRDWIVRHYQAQGFFRTGELLILEDRGHDPVRGRMTPRWTILRPSAGGYSTEAELELDLRVYSLHELVALFRQAGWRHLQAWGGLGGEVSGWDARRIVALFQA